MKENVDIKLVDAKLDAESDSNITFLDLPEVQNHQF